jgi:hypothetical protein
MPKHFFYACFVYIAARGGMIILAPLYETGVGRISSPLLMLLFIATSVFFMRRFAWTWRFIQWIAITEIVINTLFFPAPKYFGVYTDPARVLITAIIAACCVILWSLLRRSDTKVWFRRQHLTASNQRG